MRNYESGVTTGYKRIDGYERYSGDTSPSSSTYTFMPVTSVGATVVGDTVTGDDSSATGVVIIVSTGLIIITKVTGTFTATEDYTVGAVVQGTITSLPSVRGYPAAIDDATALNLAADSYRSDISAPTGSGPVRGFGILRGILYCFIDNAGATAGLIYKATSAGWAAVTLYKTISFTSGNLAIADGVTVTQVTSGATGVVKRHVLESGSYASGTAAGRFILTTITGTFDATNALQTGGVTRATSSSLLTQITILPGGRYETEWNNFTGSTDTIRMYGCDGVNPGFEFDGDVYVPINTGMTADTPLHVVVWKRMLFFSFRASLQNSGIGFPYQWTAITGAAEIGMADDITGMLVEPGDVLAITTRNSTYQLEGTSSANFSLGSLSPEVGAIPYSTQNLSGSYWLDDRGIMHISRAQEYGNFNNATVSVKVQPLIDDMRQVLVASTVYKSRNQVRFYGTDGTGIVMSLISGSRGIEHHFTSFLYPINISCAISGEDANGKDIVFLGSSDGMVYQADKGSSFDGEDIEAFVRLPFNNSRSPSTIKQYRKAILEMISVGYSEIRMHPDFSYGDPNVSQHLLTTQSIQGAGGFYDVSLYEDAYYDSKITSSPEIKIDGSGTNAGIVVYSKSDIDLGHTLHGITIHYTPRRLIR